MLSGRFYRLPVLPRLAVPARRGGAVLPQLLRSDARPFSQLNPQKQNEYAAELETLWRAQNQATGDRTSVHAEYLEVLARRA